MKKAMILALAVMLTLSLAIPAAAATAESPTAPKQQRLLCLRLLKKKPRRRTALR